MQSSASISKRPNLLQVLATVTTLHDLFQFNVLEVFLFPLVRDIARLSPIGGKKPSTEQIQTQFRNNLVMMAQLIVLKLRGENIFNNLFLEKLYDEYKEEYLKKIHEDIDQLEFGNLLTKDAFIELMIDCAAADFVPLNVANNIGNLIRSREISVNHGNIIRVIYNKVCIKSDDVISNIFGRPLPLIYVNLLYFINEILTYKITREESDLLGIDIDFLRKQFAYLYKCVELQFARDSGMMSVDLQTARSRIKAELKTFITNGSYSDGLEYLICDGSVRFDDYTRIFHGKQIALEKTVQGAQLEAAEFGALLQYIILDLTWLDRIKLLIHRTDHLLQVVSTAEFNSPKTARISYTGQIIPLLRKVVDDFEECKKTDNYASFSNSISSCIMQLQPFQKDFPAELKDADDAVLPADSALIKLMNKIATHFSPTNTIAAEMKASNDGFEDVDPLQANIINQFYDSALRYYAYLEENKKDDSQYNKLKAGLEDVLNSLQLKNGDRKKQIVDKQEVEVLSSKLEIIKTELTTIKAGSVGLLFGRRATPEIDEILASIEEFVSFLRQQQLSLNQ